MYEVLKRILVGDIHLRAEDLTPTAGREEVGVDSITAMELSSVLSSRLGIRIDDHELLDLATIGDIARLMEERHRAATEPGEPRP